MASREGEQVASGQSDGRATERDDGADKVHGIAAGAKNSSLAKKTRLSHLGQRRNVARMPRCGHLGFLRRYFRERVLLASAF